MNKTDPDDLSAKLRTWKLAPRVPSSFQRDVWQRIAVRQAALENAFWPRVLRWLSANFVRPQFAVVVVMFSVSVSVGVAHLQAQDMKAKHLKTLEARYAASIDPLEMTR